MLKEVNAEIAKQTSILNRYIDLLSESKKSLVGYELTNEGFDLITGIQKNITEITIYLDKLHKDKSMLEFARDYKLNDVVITAYK